jgi:type IV secretion system protein VirD4
MSPPRKGKTLWLCRMILRYPGPVIATSVKEDVFRLTSGIRQKIGRIHIFNPQEIGGVPSTFRINIVAGCQAKAVAIRRAQALCNATTTKGMKDADFFKDKAAQMLSGMLYTAALMKADLRVVAAWVFVSVRQAQELLIANGEAEAAAILEELHNSPAEKTSATFRMVLTQVLGFLEDPALATAVLPGAGFGFDIPRFIQSRDTLYLITDSDQDQSPLAPLFALILSEMKHEGTLIGQRNRTGRLRRPFGWFLDEITQTSPIALNKILAACGGLGIQVFTVVHGEAQLRDRWGDDGAQVIWDTSDVKILLPGITDDKTLEKASKVIGKVSLQQRGQDHANEYDVIEPSMIRALPDRMALVIRGNRAPVIVHLPRVIRAAEYGWARFRGRDVARLVPSLAEEIPALSAVPWATDPVASANGHHDRHPELVDEVQDQAGEDAA